MGINGIGTDVYTGETYQEHPGRITDWNAANAFKEAYARKMEDSTDYSSTRETMAREREQFAIEQAKKRIRRVRYMEILKESAEKRKTQELINLHWLQERCVKRELLNR